MVEGLGVAIYFLWGKVYSGRHVILLRDNSIFSTRRRDKSTFGTRRRDKSIFGMRRQDKSIFGTKRRDKKDLVSYLTESFQQKFLHLAAASYGKNKVEEVKIGKLKPNILLKDRARQEKLCLMYLVVGQSEILE